MQTMDTTSSRQAARYQTAYRVIKERYPANDDSWIVEKALSIVPLDFNPEIVDPSSFTQHVRKSRRQNT